MTSGAGDETVDREALIAAEHERCRAISDGDWPALDALLDDELTHTHTTGRVDDKGALLAHLRYRPRKLTRGPLQVRLHGDTAVMTGPQYLVLDEETGENQATQTWIRRPERWVLVAFHASTHHPMRLRDT